VGLFFSFQRSRVPSPHGAKKMKKILINKIIFNEHGVCAMLSLISNAVRDIEM